MRTVAPVAASFVPGGQLAGGVLSALRGAPSVRQQQRQSGLRRKISSDLAGGFFPSVPSEGECPGLFQVKNPLGGGCIDLAALPPGGRPAITPRVQSGGGGAATIGGFGLPAMVPDVVGSIMRRDGTTGQILRCARTMVLGSDNLCYPKAVLPRRSKFRKWPGQARPVISAADTKAIRKAARAKDRVLALAKDIGLHASKTAPKTKKAAPIHVIDPSHHH